MRGKKGKKSMCIQLLRYTACIYQVKSCKQTENY